MWNVGKMSAHATAKSVIASADRLIDVRHFWRKRKRIAEISVPAWPMPTQNTKLTMAQPQPTGTFRPHTPGPFQTCLARLTNISASSDRDTPKAIHHESGVFFSTCTETASVMSWNVIPPWTSAGSSSPGGSPYP